MAAQRYKNILFSYSGLISSTEEIEMIREYFAEIEFSIGEANYSEIIDLRRYTVTRSPNKIKKMLCGHKSEPFVFIISLN